MAFFGLIADPPKRRRTTRRKRNPAALRRQMETAERAWDRAVERESLWSERADEAPTAAGRSRARRNLRLWEGRARAARSRYYTLKERVGGGRFLGVF